MQGVARFLPLDADLLNAMVEKYLPEEHRATYLANPPEDSMFDITPAASPRRSSSLELLAGDPVVVGVEAIDVGADDVDRTVDVLGPIATPA